MAKQNFPSDGELRQHREPTHFDVEFTAQDCLVDLQVEKPTTSTCSVVKQSAGGAKDTLVASDDANSLQRDLRLAFAACGKAGTNYC